MILSVKTPLTRITAICRECGYGIYVDGVVPVNAMNMFAEHGWTENEHGKPLCPECQDEHEAERGL